MLFEENCDLRVFPLVPDLTTILLRALKWPPNELKSLQMLLQQAKNAIIYDFSVKLVSFGHILRYQRVYRAGQYKVKVCKESTILTIKEWVIFGLYGALKSSQEP